LAGSLSFLSAIGQSGRRLLLSEYFVLVLTAVYFVALLPFLPGLANPANLSNTLSNVWPLYAVAIGQTFVLAIGGIDLSQGAVVGLTSVVGAMLLATVAPGEVLSGSPIWGIFINENGGLLATADYAIPMALAAMLLVAVLIGAFNGASVAWLRMPPFMVTLVTMIAIGAFAIYITHSENIRNLPESYIALGKGDLVSVYIGSWTSRASRAARSTAGHLPAADLCLARHRCAFPLSRTVFGRQVYAIGTNRKAATVSGVPVARVIMLCSSSRPYAR
jgi:ribose/xylose/arabinose/galactoside ABC-type transport system permease subunit